MHTCTSYRCQPAYDAARKYFGETVAREEVASGKRKYVTEITKPGNGTEWLGAAGKAWLVEGNGKTELVIRFRPHIPGMQQAAYIKMMEKNFLPALPEGTRAREWRKNDIKTIEEGIPRLGGLEGESV